MNDLWKTFRLAIYVCALPLAATAGASAHQWLSGINAVVASKLPSAVKSTEYAGISVYRTHTVALDSDGAISGRVALIDGDSKIATGLTGLKAFLVRDGEIVKQVYTDISGNFVMNGIDPGAYSFVAAGETGFVAYGIHVVEKGGPLENVMETAAVSPRFIAVNEFLQKYIPKQIADEILNLSGRENVSAVQVPGANRVKLVDGQLSGTVTPIFGPHRAVEGTYVNIIKDDIAVAQTRVDSNGNFSISDLEPGVYDFVAAGETGFAAVSFEAIADAGAVGGQEASGAAGASVIEPTQDIATADVPSSLEVGLTNPQDGAFVGEQVQYACDTCSGAIYPDQGYQTEFVGESCGYGCAAGGACGSCGNYCGYSACCGAGGGGFYGGRLLGLAALGLAITALATDGQPTTPPPVSPPEP